jgi:APA family basic amino acid/polyamine antiporter
MKRAFKVPISIGKMPVLPIIAIATTLFMMINVGWNAVIYGTAIIILGIIAYYILDKFMKKGVEIKDIKHPKKKKVKI